MKAQKAKKSIVILHDGDCSDGFGGAWAAWKIFGNKADYIGVKHDNPPPQGLKNKTIYLIDFTYTEPIIRRFLRDNKLVTAIDHHATAERAAKLTQDYLFDNSHSGCALAWKYFHPTKPLPVLLKHIEAVDLWRFLPDSAALFAYLNLFSQDFKIWDKIIRDAENPKKLKGFIEKGKIVLRYEDKRVQNLVQKNSELVKFAGYKTLAVNSANWPSQVGNELVKKLPPIGIIWSRRDNKIIVSLRSDRSVDVGKLAKRFGGGGHPGSSGFSLPGNAKLPWTPIKK
ncbi:MAG: DHHA1 domain-containing protein [bacterium]|nr:DHHA1 domain-containing protein [bacterium]